MTDWGSDEAEEEDEEGEAPAPRKGLPEKKKKKLLERSHLEARRPAARSRHPAPRSPGRAACLKTTTSFSTRSTPALKKTGNSSSSAAELKLIINAVSWRVETAPPVIKKVHKPGKAKPDPCTACIDSPMDGKPAVVEYEPDSELRDYEQVPLLEDGGIEAFIRREVLPYTPDAWIVEADTKIGYEVSFTRHFYKPQPLRTLAEISADILAIEEEAGGLLDEIIGGHA